MKQFFIYISISLLLFSGCGKKINPTVGTVEHNKTIESNQTLETTLLNNEIFEWKQNDELFKEDKASKLVVVKSKRVLVLFNKEGDVLSRHRISLGDNPVGRKLEQGDFKTPEGIYSIVDMRSDPKYYKEILISYPNEEDRKRSKELGFNPGGGITFHAQVPWNWDGNGDDHTLSHDWTNGCMAMTNHGMDTVWNMIDMNTIIEIRE